MDEREFIELVVEYPPPDLCTYIEYRGKPYFSIKYRENGEAFVGFGTYKPEVLSQYLKEYFIQPMQPEQKVGKWIKMSDADGVYYCCSECGEELYREWTFDRECDLFPRKSSINKTKYCPNCGEKMEE